MSKEFKKITCCLTSCNRFHLLQHTLETFFNVNKYPIERFIITEDSANEEMHKKILDNYGSRVEVIFNSVNKGPYRSIDHMYSQVNTDYIFHCEDDWEFYGNSNFIENSLDILEERKDVHQVWLISVFTHQNGAVEPQLFYTSTNVPYKMISADHGGNWCGFSGNPGLRRKSDYVKMFPNGFAEFILPEKPIVFTEHNCNLHAGKQGYRAAILLNDACRHTGYGQSTHAK